MIRRQKDQKSETKENMRGGDGSITLIELLTPDEMYGKGRLFSKVIIKPGCSAGFHPHEGEMEAYYIIKGVGEYDDNGEKVTVYAGDLTYTPDGEGHGIRNIDKNEDLEILALILYR